MHGLIDRLGAVGLEIRKVEKEIVAWCCHDDASRRLMTIPGIGPIIASAIAATVPDASLFRSGRQFAAWLGLTPRANSSGGKERLGRISKQGDGYIRRLLVTGATAVIRLARQGNPSKVWAARLLQRKPARPMTPAQGSARVVRCDDEPVEPGMGQARSVSSAQLRGKLIGTPSADFIRASGHERRANRPDT